MTLDRRGFVAGAIFVASLPMDEANAADRPFFSRTRQPLGLQLYTLAERAAADLDGTLGAVAAIGYRTIELAGYLGRTPAALRAAIDRAGLACPSAHVPATDPGDGRANLSGDLGRLAADARVLGIGTIVMPLFPFPGRTPPRVAGERMAVYMERIGNVLDADHWQRTADLLNRTGRVLHAEGLRIAYHNHNPEFAPLPVGGTGMDILLGGTDPALVEFEMDAGWVVAAGHDPVALLRRHPRRFRQMHLKDLGAPLRVNYAFASIPVEVGGGLVDWPRLLAAARTAGVREYYAEQDAPFRIDRLDAMARSYRYLAALRR